jgi:hypothetical protein
VREVDRSDADRLKLLDRIAERVPDLDLAGHEVEWHELPDGSEVLLVDGGIDGGEGYYFENYGDDLLAFGSLAPIIAGYIGCVVIRPDGLRVALVTPEAAGSSPVAPVTRLPAAVPPTRLSVQGAALAPGAGRARHGARRAQTSHEGSVAAASTPPR